MKKSLSVILVLVLSLGLLTILFACSNGDEDEKSYKLYAEGGNIKVTATGETIVLKAVNIGGLFVQEDWMCPVTSNSQSNVTERQIRETLTARFGASEAQALLDIYRDNWFTAADLDNIKAIGFNAIRLPISYLDFMSLESISADAQKEGYGGAADITINKSGFSRIDDIINAASEKKLYVVLDLHAAPGSQNGNDHSGDTSQRALFDTPKYMDATVALWTAIADRYKDFDYVAGYDLLNEPYGVNTKTEKREWDFYDRLYKAMRTADSACMLFMEGIWEPTSSLPDPADYGWTNVVYSYHFYNWADQSNMDYLGFWAWKKLYFLDHPTVPVFAGEFTCFEGDEDWTYTLGYYAENGFSFALWTYKTVHKNSNWSLYGGFETEKVNIDQDSYDEIAAKWASVGTEKNGNFTKNTDLCTLLSGLL